jgi:hypothetical protein
MRPEDWPLEEGYSIELLIESTRAAAADVIEFWVREGAMDRRQAEKRVGEVLLVALGRDDDVVGVSSVYLDAFPRLGTDMWFQRGFVGERDRASNIGMQFAIIGIEHLERRFDEGADTRGRGVVQVLENEGLKRYFNRGWEPPTDMVFIGVNTRGDHVRVHWFPNAHVPARAPGPP